MYAVLKICDWSNFTDTSDWQNDCAILEGFYFCDTLHLRSITKNKTFAKISEFTALY